MLYLRPGVEGGHAPQQPLRLWRWRVSALPSETHMISDEWLDDFIRRIGYLRIEMMLRVLNRLELNRHPCRQCISPLRRGPR